MSGSLTGLPTRFVQPAGLTCRAATPTPTPPHTDEAEAEEHTREALATRLGRTIIVFFVLISL